MNNEQMHLFSWVKKGIGTKITEVDQLGVNEGVQKHRPSIKLSMQLKSTAVQPIDGKNSFTSTETKDFPVLGPGDVLNISSNAVRNFYPPSGHNGLPEEYKPYIEFWEPDFAWRYTPAKATGDSGVEDGRLRPWLAVIVCEKSKYTISKNKNGVDLVTFSVKDKNDDNKDKVDYEDIFPNPEDIWKSAHAQGDDESEADFCRIVCVNEDKFVQNTEYTAFVIPVFEITRLRALGFDDEDDVITDAFVQKSAWEKTYTLQQKKHTQSPFTFPAFFKWSFKTGEESFKTLVDALVPFSTETSGINVDVTNLGEGLTIKNHDPILMPAATQTPTYRPEPAFPRANGSGDERELYGKLKDLLDLNPVFQENKKLIAGSSYKQEYDKNGNADPVVVPPIYGGKHSMATNLDDAKSWVKQVNLDLHYRAAAGLGKKIVQENQEQLVNRAWKQVEIVKALNTKIYKQLAGNNVGKSLKNRFFGKLFKSDFNKDIKGFQGDNDSRSEFIKNLMTNLQSMMATGDGNLSIKQILNDRGIPTSFAATSFQSRTQQLSAKVDDLELSSLMGSIAESYAFNLPEPKSFNYYSLGQLRFFVFQTLLHSRFFVSKLAQGEQCNHGVRSNKNGMSEWKFFDFLSIHKKAPQYINWKNIDFCDLKNVVNSIYSFKIKPIEFADIGYMLDFIESKFPVEKLGVRSRSELLLQMWVPENPDDYNNPNNFNEKVGCFVFSLLLVYLSKENEDAACFWKFVYDTPSYGNVCSASNDECLNRGSLIGLNDKFYESILGGKIITRVATFEGIYYFVNRDKLCGEMLSSLESPLNKYVKVGFLFENKFLDIVRYCENNINDSDEHVLFSREDTLNCLNAPDIINIHEDAFSDPEFVKEYVNENIDGVYECVERYVNKYKNGDDKAINAYVNCMDVLKNAERGYAVKKETPLTDGAMNSDLKNIIMSVDKKTEEPLNNSAEFIQKYNNRYMNVFLNDPKLQQSFVEDCLKSKYPIMAYPQFVEPTYFYLKQLSDKFILPCVDELTDNSVSMFYSNEAFVESFLCGMNTEMGRELLWREYPTDQRGSYFKKFWDTETSVQDIKKEKYFDIKSLHTWENKLGKNQNESKSQLLMFVIKGKLMKNYPDTQIYLNKAKIGKNKDGAYEFQLMEGAEKDVVIRPAAQAFFRDDIYVVGFPISIPAAIGEPSDDPLNNTNCGYMLVFKQMMENLNFQYYDVPEGICKNSIQYAYDYGKSNPPVPSQVNPNDMVKQAIVQPYVSAKHVITYVKNTGARKS